MDKAQDFGSGDCRFESCHARDRFCSTKRILSKKYNVIKGGEECLTNTGLRSIKKEFFFYYFNSL